MRGTVWTLILLQRLAVFTLFAALIGCPWGYNPDGNKLKGVVNETISPDEITHIDARNSALKRSLNFKTTGAQEHGRYLSEYLLLVYNTGTEGGGQPCVRFRFRPDAGANYGDEDVDFFQANPSGACGPEAAEEEEEAAEEERAALAATLAASDVHRPPVFNLKQTKELCSANVFRMLAPRDGSTSSSNPRLEKIVEKTGRLMTISDDGLVRVWVDEETFRGRNPCPIIGRPFTDLPQTNFNRITTSTLPEFAHGMIFYDAGSSYDRPSDHLTEHHLQNIADETEKAYKRLSVLGEVGDVDNNGTIEVFISPEINRRLAYGGTRPRTIDEMSMLPFYRPFDVQPLDTHRNTLSNEGEIVYLWAPDPAGEHGAHHATSPGSPYIVSSNSLTTNYSKGFIGYQLMSLIIWHNKYVKHQLTAWQQDNWMRNALALLASAYVGGIDFSNKFINNYLFSRTQLVDLHAPETGEGITSDMKVLGMLTLFGWYLHARLCGQTSDICQELKRFIDNDQLGDESIAQVLGDDANDIFLNFGLSFATHVAERPDEIIALWDNKNQNFSIQRPVKMFSVDDDKHSTAVKPTPLTIERAESEMFFSESFPIVLSAPPPYADARNKFFAAPNCVETPSDAMCTVSDAYITKPTNLIPYFKNEPTAGLEDRTHAAPFLYEDMYSFWHVLMPDSELDFRTNNNTVAAVLVSAFTNNEMELLANIGRGLQLIIVPLGERDRSVRGLFKEKSSEFAHIDVSPVNLTDLEAMLDDTIYEDVGKPFADMSSYAITPTRQLWVAGSNENFNIGVCADDECEDTATKQVNDSDAYGLLFDPCPEDDATVCDKYTHQAIIQVKARDYSRAGNNAYIPFILATTANRDLFDGQTIISYADHLDIEADEGTALCQMDTTIRGHPACTNTLYDPSDSLDFHPVDNFFHAAFPHPELNFGAMYPNWRGRDGGKQRLFLNEESLRQFHTFKYPEEQEVNELKFIPVDNPYPHNAGLCLSRELANVKNAELCSLFKDAVCEAYDEGCPHEDRECDTVGDLEAVAIALGTPTAEMIDQFTESRYVCGYRSGEGCPNTTVIGIIKELFYTPAGTAVPSCAAGVPRMLRYYASLADQNIATHHEPSVLGWRMFEVMKDHHHGMTDRSCFFQYAVRNPEKDIEACHFDTSYFTDVSSILQQIDAEAMFVGGCTAETSLHDSGDIGTKQVCPGMLLANGYVRSDADDGDRTYLRMPFLLQNNRRRLRIYQHLPSEILAAEGYIDIITFNVPYDGSKTDNRALINLIVGGLNDTEGKYLIRAKIVRREKR
ncbi:MAG: hypothetical protein OYH77_01530 [Pseudomonadota bacterium]|nr:hypothetical protein [Pseudomonadota bacterium]